MAIDLSGRQGCWLRCNILSTHLGLETDCGHTRGNAVLRNRATVPHYMSPQWPDVAWPAAAFPGQNLSPQNINKTQSSIRAATACRRPPQQQTGNATPPCIELPRPSSARARAGSLNVNKSQFLNRCETINSGTINSRAIIVFQQEVSNSPNASLKSTIRRVAARPRCAIGDTTSAIGVA